MVNVIFGEEAILCGGGDISHTNPGSYGTSLGMGERHDLEVTDAIGNGRQVRDQQASGALPLDLETERVKGAFDPVIGFLQGEKKHVQPVN